MRKIVLMLILVFCIQGAIAESAPADGLYKVGVSSSAKMFKIVDCILRVEDGTLTAVLTMSGSGYGYLYQGTSAEADSAPIESWTPYFESEEGKHRFAIEIPYLDAELPMAAWSIRYEKWYDRTLQFFSNTLTPYQEIAPDGVYITEIVSDTVLDEMSCLLYSREGGMIMETDIGGEAELEVNGKPAEYVEGMAQVQIESLDMRIPICIDGEEGWLKLESAALEPHAIAVDDGVYRVEVQTDSALLRFTDCRLTAANGEMKALLTAKNNSFDYLYLGAASDANAHPDEWIEAVLNEDGAYTYEIPVVSLDNTISVATYSSKKKLWYDRQLIFDSQTLVEQE